MKITDLKETKLTTKSRVGANGQREHYKEEIQLKRKVKTITGGARFGHYLIDGLIIAAVAFAYVYITMQVNGSSYYYSRGYSGFQIDYSGYIITLLYYGGFEAWLGTTPGKLALKRYVIDEYAQKPDIGTILGRSICRLVPFEAFSCLGDRGWHDKWSNTYVVSQEERDYLRKQLDADFSADDELLDG